MYENEEIEIGCLSFILLLALLVILIIVIHAILDNKCIKWTTKIIHIEAGTDIHWIPTRNGLMTIPLNHDAYDYKKNICISYEK